MVKSSVLILLASHLNVNFVTVGVNNFDNSFYKIMIDGSVQWQQVVSLKCCSGILKGGTQNPMSSLPSSNLKDPFG